MNINRNSQQPAFSGSLNIISYKKVGDKMEKSVTKMVTNHKQDAEALELSETVREFSCLDKIKGEASKKCASFFEKITGKVAPETNGTKYLSNTSSQLMYGDADPEKTGGIIYDMKF